MSIRKLSPELQEKAKKELNEDPVKVKENIQHIKDWLKVQPHLKSRTDDQWILTFLRSCKFNVEETKEKLDFFYTIRTMLPEFFTDRDPMRPEIQEILNMGIYLPITHRENETDPSIVIFRAGACDPDKYKQEDVMKVQLMAMDIALLEEDYSVINGVHIMQDMAGFTMEHLFTPALIKKATTVFDNTYPATPKQIHCFNLPTFFDTMYAMVKPLVPDRMMQRNKIYTGGIEELLKNFPVQNKLPKEYGGRGPSIEEIKVDLKKKVEEYRDWFLEDIKYGVDESKRPGKPKTADEIFGIVGSYDKLNVD